MFEDRVLREIELHPVDLQREKARPQRGRPILADEETGLEILDRLEDLSDPYNTEIEQENGIGKIVADTN